MSEVGRTRPLAEHGGLRFRMAEAADIPAIVALVESAYRGDSSRTGWTTEADLLHGQRTDPEQITALLDAPDDVLFVAVRGDEVIACCQLQNRGPRAYFGLFAVSPQAQGSGLGKQVIAYAERYAATTWSSRHMEMTVIRQRADLIAFYERRGYRDTGIRSPFPYGDERFGIPQRDDLEFTLLEKDLADNR
ncbi:MAG TPA: GNAT family N-acetyltransferase [Flexivirga sp.]|uniref:GNAT family N-acetyltransferase n=1 Tax=Flexivirga sp. TaxID=1962927 RepID=UPI002CC4FD49|nr:GNAT family N-acetyltransferase [Flexivirga sp.]HWC21520.1 GNAT family N-acetyltransferase [Flexivirga sp.]